MYKIAMHLPRLYKRYIMRYVCVLFLAAFGALVALNSAQAAQTINTTSTTSCAAQGGTLTGGNILTDFNNGTFGTGSGAANQSPSTNPYPGQISGGVFANFYSFFHGAYGFVSNAQTPRNTFQHAGITDPVYGATGRFFASDPNVDTPIINFTALNVLANQNYQLSFWAANSEPNGAPNDINLEIDGIVSLNTGPLQAFNSALEWRKYAFVFNAGNRTTVLIALRSLETGAGGRDFYLDNVEMTRCVVAGSNISGFNYSDVDRDNSYQSAREAGLNAVAVALYDTRGDTNTANDLFISTTDSITNGAYNFLNIPPNPNYQLRVATTDSDLPTGSVIGTPPTINVNLGTSNSVNNNFGFDLPRPNLTISKTSQVSGAPAPGIFAIPGNEVEYTVTISNAGGQGADLNSVFLFDSLPPQITFFSGDFNGAAAGTDPVIFSQTGAGLDFLYSRDIRYSNGSSTPTSLAQCNYTPMSNYDAAIKYICFNPKGVMHGGTSPPSFQIKFRALIK